MPSATIDQSLFDSIPDAIASFRTPPSLLHLSPPIPFRGNILTHPPGSGEFLVVLDDPSRENEADLILAAEDATPENMAFMIRHSSGLICAPILEHHATALALPQMVAQNQDSRGTAYTITVDSADPSVTTGISAQDRALALRTLADKDATVASFRRPGHVLPLRAREGGVRERPGHTEAAVDLCRLAGKRPAAAICEVVDDGEEVPGRAVRVNAGMLRGEKCIEFARRWGLKVVTIADLVAYLEKTEGKLGANGAN